MTTDILDFRRYDAASARDLRNVVEEIYTGSYTDAIADGGPFHSASAFMIRFDSYVKIDGFRPRDRYKKSLTAAVSRMAATLVSFVLCLAYLAFLPFHPWGLALLVGLSVLVTALIGRPGDEITAGITTAVVLVAAKLSPHDAWRQPILRLADTAIGVAVGLMAAWLGLRAVRPLIRPSSSQTLGEYAP